MVERNKALGGTERQIDEMKGDRSLNTKACEQRENRKDEVDNIKSIELVRRMTDKNLDNRKDKKHKG